MNRPASYTAGNSLQRLNVSDFVDEFVDELGEMSGRCLDIGSGPGDTLVDLILPKLNPNATVVCTDISENMLNYGKEKYKDNPRLTFVKLDIESTELPEDMIEQFDHLMSLFCLHWCQDMDQACKNMFNLLRPGGTGLLTFVAKSVVYDTYKVLAAMPQYQPYMTDVDRYISVFYMEEQPRETLKALLKASGFEVHHCSIRERSYFHKTPDMLSEFLLPLNPFMERMPAELKEEYRKDLINEVIGRIFISNNKIINEEGGGMLCVYRTFVVFVKRPSTK